MNWKKRCHHDVHSCKLAVRNFVFANWQFSDRSQDEKRFERRTKNQNQKLQNEISFRSRVKEDCEMSWKKKYHHDVHSCKLAVRNFVFANWQFFDRSQNEKRFERRTKNQNSKLQKSRSMKSKRRRLLIEMIKRIDEFLCQSIEERLIMMSNNRVILTLFYRLFIKNANDNASKSTTTIQWTNEMNDKIDTSLSQQNIICKQHVFRFRIVCKQYVSIMFANNMYR